MKNSLALPPQENSNPSYKMEEKLLDIPKQNIFQVPEGYFDVILHRIQVRLQQQTPNAFSDRLPLEEYSPIHDLVKNELFVTPTHYFETLYTRIQSRLQSHTEPLPLNFEALENFENGLVEVPLYAVPENYFEALSERILSKIVSAPTQKPAPLEFDALEEGELGILATIPKQNVFQLPENYFEKLSVAPEKLSESAETETNKQEAKVIQLIPGWAKYAASIAATTVVLLTGYWFSPRTTISTDECTELLCNISDEEILQYLETQDVRFTQTKTDALPAKTDDSGLDQLEFSEDELLNAAESIE